MIDARMAELERLTAEAAALAKQIEAAKADLKQNPPEVIRVSRLFEDAPGEYRVWTEDSPQIGEYPYRGPVAHVFARDEFFYVQTDECEGTAMINVTSLPDLIEALTRLQRHLASLIPSK